MEIKVVARFLFLLLYTSVARIWGRLIRYRTGDGRAEYGEPILADHDSDASELAVKGLPGYGRI